MIFEETSTIVLQLIEKFDKEKMEINSTLTMLK